MAAIKKGMILGDVYISPGSDPLSRKKWPVWASSRSGGVNGETKGGTVVLRPVKIIVCSNYTIQECFPDPRDHMPLLRRFQVREFSGVRPGCQAHLSRLAGASFDLKDGSVAVANGKLIRKTRQYTSAAL